MRRVDVGSQSPLSCGRRRWLCGPWDIPHEAEAEAGIDALEQHVGALDTTTHVVGVVLHRGVALEDAPTEEHVAVLGRAVQTGRVQPAEHHLHAVVGLVQRVAIAREGEGEPAVGTPLGTT